METKKLKILFVSGMSGAGKTQAMRILEDMNYFCIDNLPASLVIDLVRTFLEDRKDRAEIERIAIAVDVRGREFLQFFHQTRQMLEMEQIPWSLLYLDATDGVLMNRYKESRRRHPLQEDNGMLEAIGRERRLLEDIREVANRIIDTSHMSVRAFGELMQKLYREDEPRMIVALQSFGFKYGIPLDADLVVDVRFLPNPFYDPSMREQTGLDEPVRRFVLDQAQTRRFLDGYADLLRFLIPAYVREGKRQMVLAVGCTGGQHRSVALAEELARRISGDDVRIMVSHRDLDKRNR